MLVWIHLNLWSPHVYAVCEANVQDNPSTLTLFPGGNYCSSQEPGNTAGQDWELAGSSTYHWPHMAPDFLNVTARRLCKIFRAEIKFVIWIYAVFVDPTFVAILRSFKCIIINKLIVNKLAANFEEWSKFFNYLTIFNPILLYITLLKIKIKN